MHLKVISIKEKSSITRKIDQIIGTRVMDLALLLTRIAAWLVRKSTERVNITKVNMGMQELNDPLNKQSLEIAMQKSQEEVKQLRADTESFLGKAYFKMYRRSMKAEGISFVKGELATRTIVFMDLKNFTAISKKFRDAGFVTDLFYFVNLLLGEIVPIIEKHRSSIDKFNGDSAMGISHGKDDVGIVDAWLELKEVLETLNVEIETGFVGENKLQHLDESEATNYLERVKSVKEAIDKIRKDDPSFVAKYILRAGAQLGEVMIGDIGSKDRHNITCIGPAANEASRFEDLGRFYGYEGLVIGQDVKNKLDEQGRDDIVYKKLYPVVPIGSDELVNIYAVIGYKKELSNNLLENVNMHNKAIDLMISEIRGSLMDAKRIFDDMLERDPLDKLTIFFVDKLGSAILIPRLFSLFIKNLIGNRYGNASELIHTILRRENDPDNKLAQIISKFIHTSDVFNDEKLADMRRLDLLQRYLPELQVILFEIRDKGGTFDVKELAEKRDRYDKLLNEMLREDPAIYVLKDYLKDILEENKSLVHDFISGFFYPKKK